MPAERPTIASCPHCRAILLRTPRALIHPMGSEREEIERALGPFWFEHSTTRFDGRFHRCLGREPIVFASGNRKANDEPRDPPDTGHPVYRGPHREVKTSNLARQSLLIAAFVASLASFSNAQQHSNAPHHRPPVAAESAADVTRVFEQLSTHLAKADRRPIDQSVILVGGTTQAGNVLSRATSDTAQPMRSGSWQGMELASGRYQILDILRRAAMGVVYLAHDRNLDADVVVEVPAFPPIHNHESTARFMRAVRSGARLVHPHLVRITEVGTYADAPFVVAEHRAGGSLRFRRPVGPDGRPTPVAPHSLEEWLPDVSDALDFLHAQNRFSREVSLANILFDENGHASLGGLGMAEAIEEWLGPSSGGAPVNHQRLTGPSPVLAPEIVAGAPADGQADQYALAATVYELLSGHPPFKGPNLAGLLGEESSIEPPELHQVCPTISQALSSAVHRGLAQDPRHRFPDCRAFARAVVLAARESGPILEPRTEPAVATETDRTLAGLPIIDHGRVPTQASHLVLGIACGFLIVIIGATARRKRSRRTTEQKTVISSQHERRAVPKSLPLAGSASSEEKARSLANSTPHGEPGSRALDVRRHATELAGRPHFTQVPALLPAKSTGRELVRLPDLDPSMDRPKTRLADNLLPVASTVPARSASLPQPVRRRAS